MEKAVLLVEVGEGVDNSDALKIRLSGTPNQALGFIARARFEIDKLEAKVLADLKKEKA